MITPRLLVINLFIATALAGTHLYAFHFVLMLIKDKFNASPKQLSIWIGKIGRQIWTWQSCKGINLTHTCKLHSRTNHVGGCRLQRRMQRRWRGIPGQVFKQSLRYRGMQKVVWRWCRVPKHHFLRWRLVQSLQYWLQENEVCEQSDF